MTTYTVLFAYYTNEYQIEPSTVKGLDSNVEVIEMGLTKSAAERLVEKLEKEKQDKN